MQRLQDRLLGGVVPSAAGLGIFPNRLQVPPEIFGILLTTVNIHTGTYTSLTRCFVL